jgi:2-polyprenyl-3-methyl-5-hydroxy-6-metoxy-1,4-benzoquinol methylase/glycosyltransferase involved in cell wall biosynthesis
VEATLKSLRERTPQAEIVVVDTMSSDRTPEICQQYADIWIEYKGPRGDWSREMFAFDDASAARQKAFESATGVWRGWIDTDDRLVGPEEAERLLRLNGRWQPPIGDKRDGGAPGQAGLEELLAFAAEKTPQAPWVWAPYLYQRAEDGRAITWQHRERIVRWDLEPRWGRWKWHEAGHEVLAATKGVPPKIELPHLLFVHEKVFDAESQYFSYARHFAILERQYRAGDVTTRRAIYLAEFARVLCPAREMEFLEAAKRTAATFHDRYVAELAIGGYYVRRGLHRDALEHFAAATHLRSDLPDAWFVGGEAWFRNKDPRAIDWLEKGLAIPLDPTVSFANPRDAQIKYPSMLAEMYREASRHLVASGRQPEALAVLGKAKALAAQVLSSEAIGDDRQQAQGEHAAIENEERREQAMMAMRFLFDYLLANDESEKASKLVELYPWNAADHPILRAMEPVAERIRLHLEDAGAYRSFYEDAAKTNGLEPTPEEWTTPEHSLARAHWIIEWIRAHHLPTETVTVLDVGAWDGVIGLPLLQACPNVHYIGVEPNADARERLIARATKRGVGDRASVLARLENYRGQADVVLFTEVIEHVPDPGATLRDLADVCRGVILLTTPWGSFDQGHPPAANEKGAARGHLAHVRALLPRDLVRQAQMHVESAEYVASPTFYGDELRAVVRPRQISPAAIAGEFSLAFAVSGALWDWNGSVVRRDGIGASEETIVYLAEALAAGGRHVNVFGPVPREEVCQGVGYWPREAIRKRYLSGRGPLVISRAPYYLRTLEEQYPGISKGRRTVLWLQDAVYDDLPETWSLYDRIVVVSEWHRQAMHERHGVPLGKMDVIYNFVLPEHFRIANPPGRRPDRFIYASSPDRGAIPLLKLWPRIRERLPEAEVRLFYGWKGAERLGLQDDPGWARVYESTRREFEELRHQPGVFVHGLVNHPEIARAYLASGVWLYRTRFQETCCTAAIKARAGGCIPVYAPEAALTETAVSEASVAAPYEDEDTWVEAAVAAAKVTADDPIRRRIADTAIAENHVGVAVEKWRGVLWG